VTDVRGIAIGIPAHDEAERVARALRAVLLAARNAGPVVVVVTADSCRDATEAVARAELRRLPTNVEAHVIRLDARRAGVARQLACRVADARLKLRVGERAPRWIATTDADSTVPADWLSTHRRWAQHGADAIAGLVQIDPDDDALPAAHQRLDRELRVGAGHHHVFGANLGVTADWWHRVGGFAPVEVGEDRLLVERLRARGARVLGVADAIVLTSGRLTPRAPNGFGANLAALARQRPASAGVTRVGGRPPR
jgi:cellulose synthase/poly-beta-1,6-N-acetylglucosamine synthase-like glycosyltransferase